MFELLSRVPAHRVRFPYFVLLVLTEGPDGPQVPAGASAIGEALNDQVHACQALLAGRGFPHGRWSIGDPGTPVVLHGVHREAACAFTQVLCCSTSEHFHFMMLSVFTLKVANITLYSICIKKIKLLKAAVKSLLLLMHR